MRRIEIEFDAVIKASDESTLHGPRTIYFDCIESHGATTTNGVYLDSSVIHMKSGKTHIAAVLYEDLKVMMDEAKRQQEEFELLILKN